VRLLVGSAALASSPSGAGHARLVLAADRDLGQIYSILTLGLGLLIGRAGMVSLCQFLLLAIGAWVALRLDYATSLPFPLLVLSAGVVTA
jgi:ABC-type branched-subunit amino acid transport system permease subunit